VNRQRYLSLDVFRGATVALMILVNNPGSWSHLYSPLAHAPWHGVTLTDLVFPFFLFAVGNAMAFALPASNTSGWGYTRKIFKRTAWIFGLGLFLNLSPFVRWSADGELVWRSLDNLRWLGVLQRIALAYCAAARLLRHVPSRHVPWLVAGMLLIYWALCVTLGAAGDAYSLEGFFGTTIDRQWLGVSHLYQGEGVAFDPEGLASTLPCVAQVLIGYLVGQSLVNSTSSPRLVWHLVFLAVMLLLAGWAWALVMPLNKKLWTSSYVLLSSGWAVAFLVMLIQTLERWRWTNPVTTFCEVFGSNALFIFVLSGFLPRVIALLRWQDGIAANGTPHYTQPLRWLHDSAIAPWFADPRAGSLAYALLLLFFYWLIAQQLFRRRIFIKV
jgi:predicted acyltransferase